MNVKAYSKFIAAAVGAVVVYLSSEGIVVPEEVSETVIAAITAVVVYLVRNG